MRQFSARHLMVAIALAMGVIVASLTARPAAAQGCTFYSLTPVGPGLYGFPTGKAVIDRGQGVETVFVTRPKRVAGPDASLGPSENWWSNGSGVSVTPSLGKCQVRGVVGNPGELPTIVPVPPAPATQYDLQNLPPIPAWMKDLPLTPRGYGGRRYR